jgi:hypothetical protein
MMPGTSGVHAVAHQLPEVDGGFLPPSLLIPGAAGAQHLLHRLGQAISIAEHQPVELLLLRLRQLAALQGFQMQANRGDRRFQFVGNGVDEAVVLLAAANFTQQKGGVHDHARNDHGKKDHPEEQQHSLAPVEDDPSDIERNRQRHQANAQAEKEHDSSAAARDAHGVRVILQRGGLCAATAGSG